MEEHKGTDLMTADGLQAQQSVIGSMLIDERCIGAVVSLLREEDFSNGTCRNTFAAIKKRFLANKPVDPVLIQEQVGGGEQWVGWARDVMTGTPTAANVELYADLVRRQAVLFRLRDLADRLLACLTMEDAQAVVRQMSGAISETGRMERMTALELANDFYRRVSSAEKPEYLPWGIPTANRVVYAERGDLCLLGGYPSAGKTLLSIQMALAQAKRHKVVYYTLETRPEKMADRLFAHLAQISLTAIKTRELDQAQMVRVTEAAGRFVDEMPIEFVRAAGSTVDDIAADAVSKGAEIAYIDYLQLVEAPGRDRFSQVTAVSRGLKLFAQSHNIAVVALAQLSRPEKSGKDKRLVPPSMQSFRESGQIEQDADVAFLLWADDPDNNASRRVLKLGKNKEGQRFRVYLDFDGATQTMVEVESRPGSEIAAQLSAQGRAIKRANRARADQVEFEEMDGPDTDNPFV